MMIDILKISKDSPLYEMLSEMAGIIVREAKPATKKELVEFLDEEYGDPEIASLMAKGYKIYTGSFCDEDTDAERMLCNNNFNVHIEDFVMLHEGGY